MMEFEIRDKGDLLSFGKYKGKSFEEVPDDYLVWLYINVKRVANKASEELARRFNFTYEETVKHLKKVEGI